MSFDVNVLSQKPVIKAAANMQNDGGGGNLGYMSQGRRGEKEKKEEINIFAQKPERDTFTVSGKYELGEEKPFDIVEFIDELIIKIRSYFKV